jgi:OmcA/MtrC family decaheme c-type cytochrome
MGPGGASMRDFDALSFFRRALCLLLGFTALLTTGSATAATNDDYTIINYGPLTALNISITGASLGTTSTVDFSVTDQNGNAFGGLPVSALEVTLAKLVPGTDGDPPRWQSYINSLDTPTPGVGPGTQPTINGGRDSGGSLADHGNGTYTYTFGTHINAVTTPIPVSFAPNLTHRIAIALRSSTLPQANTNNAIYTWQPSTGATTGILTSDIVETASCNECHSHLAVHGGPRQDTRMCVTCHQPGTAESNSGNSLSFEVMTHKIHSGARLPSVQAGMPYVIYGFRDSVNDFSDVEWPQDTRNCTKCHDPSNPDTPDAQLISAKPTIAACGACHDDVDFALGQAGGHPGGVQLDNSQCTICHSQNGFAGSVQQSHRIPGKIAAQSFQYNILGVTNTGLGSRPTIRFSVTNPLDSDHPYNIATDPAFTAGGGASRLNIIIAWDTFDYSNDGSGSVPGQPVSFNALAATAVGDGSYTITSPTAIPLNTMGSGSVAMEGHPAGDFDGDGIYTNSVPVKSVVSYFPITDSVVQPRRVVVDTANCQKCHGQNDGLSLHGSNRTDNTQVCVMCHNPNATDLAQRPADPDGTPNGINLAAVDGLEQRPINFPKLIHSIHSADFRTTGFTVYGFRGSINNFDDVGYPGILSNCRQCHAQNTFRVPLQMGLLGTTVDTHATRVATASGGTAISPIMALANGSLFSRISPTAAVCSTCHDDVYSKAHMAQNGGSFYSLQVDIDGSLGTTESCSVCHRPGTIADVDVVHGIQ